MELSICPSTGFQLLWEEQQSPTGQWTVKYTDVHSVQPLERAALTHLALIVPSHSQLGGREPVMALPHGDRLSGWLAEAAGWNPDTTVFPGTSPPTEKAQLIIKCTFMGWL